MGEGELFGDYTRMRELRIDGEVRGEHAKIVVPQRPDRYEARVDVAGLLPALRMSSRWREGLAPAHRFGPRLSIGEAALDAEHWLQTHGWGFQTDLLLEPSVRRPLLELRRLIDRLEVEPLPTGRSLLTLHASAMHQAERIDAAIELVRALGRRADGLVDEGAAWPDAMQRLVGRSQGIVERSPEQLAELMAHVTDATSWVSGTAARVGDHIEARLALEELGAPLEGTLQVGWLPFDDETVTVALQGALPGVDATQASLEPQPTGLFGFFDQLGELKVGDKPLDDAYLIRAGPEAKDVLLHGRAHLCDLAAFSARVRYAGPDLTISLARVPAEPATLAHTVQTTLELWRRTALWRAGIREEAVDPTAW